MKKTILLIFIILGFSIKVNAEINRIVSGRDDARITIIAYESLTCSHCADFHNNIYPLIKKEFIDTGLVKIEFRHFPLDIIALNASKISQCKQDQNLEIMMSLFSDQQAWIKGKTIEEANENLKKFVEDKNFNLDFEKCISDKNIEDFVLTDRIEGTKKFEINSTPTIIINGKKFEKALNYKNLKKYLEKLI